MKHIRSLPLTLVALIGATAVLASGCDSHSHSTTMSMTDLSQTQVTPPSGREFAVIAGGCFWCTEAIYAEMNGVEKVESGYTGGHIKNPGYREICTGRTGHAEAVRITFDPAVVSFGELLDVFWRTHNPTTLNRQGADVGTQYRSAIFRSPRNSSKWPRPRCRLRKKRISGRMSSSRPSSRLRCSMWLRTITRITMPTILTKGIVWLW